MMSIGEEQFSQCLWFGTDNAYALFSVSGLSVLTCALSETFLGISILWLVYVDHGYTESRGDRNQ